MKKLLSVALATSLLLSAGGNAFAATGNDVVNAGSNYLGTPYQYGAPLGNIRSFDCSSYTSYVYAQFGVKLPRTSAQQAQMGKPVSKSNLQAGDLVFFKTTSSNIGHVGIYVGGGKMIGAASSTGVATVSMSNSYWGPRYVTARRVLATTPVQAVAKKPAAAPAVSSGATYVVKGGDTLFGISLKHKTSVAALKSVNSLKSDTIYIGQRLKLSGKAPAATKPAVAKGSYKVQRGDSLWGIAKRHGTSVSKLKSANNLKTNVIHPGQTLALPK